MHPAEAPASSPGDVMAPPPGRGTRRPRRCALARDGYPLPHDEGPRGAGRPGAGPGGAVRCGAAQAVRCGAVRCGAGRGGPVRGGAVRAVRGRADAGRAGLGVGGVRASTSCGPATRVRPGPAPGGAVAGPFGSVSGGASSARRRPPPGHRFGKGGTVIPGPETGGPPAGPRRTRPGARQPVRLPPGKDEIGDDQRRRHGRGVVVAGGQVREDRRIDHAQALDAAHAQAGVNDVVIARPHRAGAE